MSEEIYVTISGIDKYYGHRPFKIGNIIRLVKAEDNENEKIRAELPYIGEIGFVAERPEDVLGGTISGGRLYDRFSQFCFAQVCFTSKDAAIAQIVKGGHLHILFSIDELMEEEA